MSDFATRWMAAELATLKQRLRDLEQADQAGQRSFDDAALEFFDDDDQLRARIGKQPDGAFTVKAFGKKPATPTEPDVLPVSGGCVVEWDGTFEEAQPDDVQRIAVHLGTTADFPVVTGEEDDDSDADATERAAILSPRGGSVFLALDPGEDKFWVRLTAVAEGGIESDPSPAVEVTPETAEAVFFQDTFTLPVAGGQTLKLTYEPLDHSDHLYWNGLYQREDVTWTRLEKTVTLTGAPFPPRAGDIVTVEYAYLPGQQPEEITYYRGTPVAAWYVGSPSVSDSWQDEFYVRFKEDVLDLPSPGYVDRAAALDYITGDLDQYALAVRFFEEYLDGTLHDCGWSYTNTGIPYTGWREDWSGTPVRDTFSFWTLYHTLNPGERHPHNVVAAQLYPLPLHNSPDTDPEPGDNDPRNGIFWFGPQLPGKPRPWGPYGGSS